MKTIHLAAGRGTRLRPLTDDQPKPLVELAGQSLLERNVDTLRSANITDQLVVTGYESERIEELGLNTVHNDAYAETEMVYSLFCASDQFPRDQDLIISYGDIVYSETVVESLVDCDAPLCVVVDRQWQTLWEQRFDNPLDDAETLQIESGLVTEIGAEPTGYHEIDGQYIGLIKVRNDYVDEFIDEYEQLDQESIHMTRFIQQLINADWDVAAVEIDAGWVEVDTLDDLETYRQLVDADSSTEHTTFLQ